MIMDRQGVEIKIAGWYVVRSWSGTILVLKFDKGSEVAAREILDGPFSHRQDASTAAAAVPRLRP